MRKFALVQLIPKDMRSQESINVGLEIIKDKVSQSGWQVDIVKYGDKIEVSEYDIIGFNIFYVTQQLNLVPFLRDNQIEPIREKRFGKPLLVAGGQGVQNPKPISNFIDIFVIGDGEGLIERVLEEYTNGNVNSLNGIDGIYIPQITEKVTFNRKESIDSTPYTYKKRAMIELNRGCKSRCKFCQYGYSGGKYREKDFELLKSQILEVKNSGINNINFLSCNLGGYSEINNLLEFCIEHNIRLSNTDIKINEYPKIAKLLDVLKVRTLKFGLESFSEKTRFAINKNITNDDLEFFIDTALKNNISNLHFYLIYGLPPEEDYDEWFCYIKKIKEKIKAVDRNIRIEYSITNFEPALFTPYENANLVDFEEKHNFLRKYLKTLQELGVIEDADKKWYHNMHGRIGRKENPYKLTMMLLHGGSELGDVLVNIKKGITRSIKDSYFREFDKYQTI